MNKQNQNKNNLVNTQVSRKEFSDLLITVDYIMDTIQKIRKDVEELK